MTINIVKNLIAVSLCLCVFIWSITPTFSNTPAVLDIIQTQVAAAKHGHTHGAEEDLYWAMHGHDHDHSHGYFSLFAIPNVGFFISTFGNCTGKLELDTKHSELTNLHVCKFRAAAWKNDYTHIMEKLNVTNHTGPDEAH